MDRKREKHEYPPQKEQTDKGLMYISTPKEIESVIRLLGKNKLISTKDIAEYLTKKHGTDYTCPLTTGIFTSIVANAVEEELNQGKALRDVTPYWHVVRQGNLIYDKYLGQPSKQKERLEQEGYQIVPSGVNKSKYKVLIN